MYVFKDTDIPVKFYLQFVTRIQYKTYCWQIFPCALLGTMLYRHLTEVYIDEFLGFLIVVTQSSIILFSGKIIKEMPGSVARGTPCTIV